MQTAIKNKKLGEFLSSSEGLQKLKANYDKIKSKAEPSVLFDIWFQVSMMRDLARNIFHGSVLCDITENCSSLYSFA
jgi:hypothetical protein